ncbi:MAG: hypothetical protein AAF694_10250 [Bacteroidota bacterium]
MDRRKFIVNSSGMVLSTPFFETFPQEVWQKSQRRMAPDENLVLALTQENDRGMSTLLQRQQVQAGHPFFGGFPNQYQLYHAMSAAVFLQRAASAWVSPESVYVKSPTLVEAMERALTFLHKVQYEDGTIDLLTTNFHSTPDTAFVVEPVALGYGLMVKEGEREEVASILALWKSFLIQAGRALSSGGIHTPNHRWVVCMALARLQSLFPNSLYQERIGEWLAEGIDIDPDGQYTEKSTHIYSPLTNRCLITIARLTDREDLLDPVRKNLEMTLYYLHPDNSVATEASRRQDQFQQGSLQQYVYPYRYMAIREGNGRFSAISQVMMRQLTLPQLVRNLGYLQEDAFLRQDLPAEKELPESYVREFPYSQLLRIRRGKRDGTILANNERFFTFQVGEARILAIRIACAFFGKGQFLAGKIRREDNSYVLEQSLSGPYYQPLAQEQISGDGNWEKMPRSKRIQSEIQRLTAQIKIEEFQEGFRLQYNWEGTEHIPIALEIGFPKEGKLKGISALAHTKDAFLLEEGMGVFQVGEDRISFGPGRAEHSYVAIRGALPKIPGNSVYLTGYTPFKGVLEIQALS